MSPYTLAEARARAMKPRDSWWTVFFVDPIAIRLALVIANRTPFTPNQLTLGSFGMGLAAAWLFWGGTRGGLIAGALVYHLSFIVDCVDGKVARLKGSGSPLGRWLDYVLDRARVVAASVGLMVGQYERTQDPTYLWLAGVVIVLDMLRYINALRSSRVTAAVERAADESRAQPFGGVRARLASKRIRPHLFSGVEFQMFVFVLGPLSGGIIEVTIASAVLLLAFEAAAAANLRHVVRSHAEETR